MRLSTPPPIPQQRRRVGGDRYELLEVAGKGGMATVWRARLEGPGRFQKTVAIKHMFPHLGERKIYRDMFFEEARIGSVLQDPNIPQVNELLVEGGDHFIIMEYVEGIALATFIRYSFDRLKQPTRWDLIAAVGIGMLRGLAAAHERLTEDGRREPIIHRDVSPHNVLISTQGPAKLIDFGLSLAGDRDCEDTDPGIAKGKLAYLSPEVARGDRATPAADQFAAGSVLWEALVGKRLFDGVNHYEAYKKLASAEVAPLRKLRPEIPRALIAVIERALSREPEDRYPSTRDMAKELGDVLKASTASEDLYATLARTVTDARDVLGIGKRTQGASTETPIPELESELVELVVENDERTGLRRLIPAIFDSLLR
jgi:serine/threonine-protein kinase